MKRDDLHSDWEVFDSFDGAPRSAPVQTETNRAILIKLLSPGALARGQGATAAFAESLAPAFVEARVYDEVASQLKGALADQNVEADISIVEPTKFASAGMSYIGSDLAYLMGGAGVVGALYWLYRRSRRLK